MNLKNLEGGWHLQPSQHYLHLQHSMKSEERASTTKHSHGEAPA